MQEQVHDVRLSRRQMLSLSSVGTVTALLAACGATHETSAPQTVNVGASKADGRILFAKAHSINNGGNDDGIYLVENAGKSRKIIGKAGDDYALQYPRWSPDGTRIAFARAGDGGNYSDLWIANSDGTNPRRLTDFKSKIAHANNVNLQGQYIHDSGVVVGVAWSQKDFLTFASDKGNRSDPANNRIPRPWVVEDPNDPATVRFIPATQAVDDVDNTALSADGNAMAFSSLWQAADTGVKGTQIFLLDFTTKKTTQLTSLALGAYDPAFSPDGQYITFTGRPEKNLGDLYLMTRDGNNQVQITNTGAARAPVWSPDGKRLAFLAAFEGAQFNIYVMDVSLPAPGTPLTAANFSKPEKLTDETGIDARSGLSWTAS